MLDAEATEIEPKRCTCYFPLMKDPIPASHVLVLTPWQTQLYDELSAARGEVLIASPFIKEAIVTRVRAALIGRGVSFQDFVGKGNGRTKGEARNAASFALLMQMREAGFITKMKESLSIGSDKTEQASLGDAS